ncbi:MAG: hypothetical protein ABIP75_16615, partial [Pyrinomonadaceae bacterium]
IGGAGRNNIARLDPVTGLADSFDPNANNRVYTISVQANGKIVVGGQFTIIGLATRLRIARLDGVTGVADSWDPICDGDVYSIVLQSNGKLLACGRFGMIGGQPRNNIARLDPVTGSADSWDPNANVGLQGVYSMAVQADGKVVVAYGGGIIAGQTRLRLARIDGVTGLADSFDPAPNGFVYAVAVQSDGKILAAGDFTNIGGQARNLFARLSNDTPALQGLSVLAPVLIWGRNGSGPQFSRVTFELSTDNGANYTFLGEATTSRTAARPATGKGPAQLMPDSIQASGYVLNGLSLPLGQNILIRGRGFYRSSFLDGSESTEELVRAAFLNSPLAANASVSGQVLTTDGRGLSNAIVLLTGAGGNTRTAITSAFGYYQFDEVGAGQFVVLSVSSKRYLFTPQAMTVNGNITELNFTAEQ